MYDFVGSVVFEPGNEEDTSIIPLPEELKVRVATVNNDDATRRKNELAGSDDIGSLAISNHGKVRQIAIVVKQKVEFNSTFILPKVSPWEETQTQVDSRRVKTEQFVLETKASLLARSIILTEVPQIEEDVLIQMPGAMGVGIGKRALSRAACNPRWLSLPQVTDSPSLISRKLFAWAS